MKFEVGDIVRAVEDLDQGSNSLIKGMLYRITGTTRYGQYIYVVNYGDIATPYNQKGVFFPESLELGILDTRLNRILYPELTSNGRGFLS
jgi:hypothetical protein